MRQDEGLFIPSLYSPGGVRGQSTGALLLSRGIERQRGGPLDERADRTTHGRTKQETAFFGGVATEGLRDDPAFGWRPSGRSDCAPSSLVLPLVASVGGDGGDLLAATGWHARLATGRQAGPFAAVVLEPCDPWGLGFSEQPFAIGRDRTPKGRRPWSPAPKPGYAAHVLILRLTSEERLVSRLPASS